MPSSIIVVNLQGFNKISPAYFLPIMGNNQTPHHPNNMNFQIGHIIISAESLYVTSQKQYENNK